MRTRESYHITDNSEFAIVDTIFFSKARAELAGLLDKVNDDAAPIEIVRRDKPSAVLMGKDEYESLVETIHLLSSPANAARLLKAKQDLEAGNFAEPPATFDIGR